MKKIRCFLLFLLSFPLLFGLSAQAEENSEDTLPDEYTAFWESIPEEIRDLLPEELFSDKAQDVEEGIRKASDFASLLKALLQATGTSLTECLHLLATVAGILILATVLRTLQSTLRRSLSSAFSLCIGSITILTVLSKGYGGIAEAKSYFDTLVGFTSAAIPMMGAMYAIGGNLSTAVASSSSLTVYMSVVEGVIGKSIVPFSALCLSFALLGCIDPPMKTGTLISTVKKNYTTVLSFLMMLLIAMLTSQTVLGSKSDTLAMKSAKFAAGSMIPVVGGSVAELLKSVGAGVSYLRGTVGICAVLLLLFLLLPPIIKLLFLRLTWQISASLADLLGCDSEKRLLEELASVNGYLVTAMFICSSVLFLSITLLLHCASAIG